MASTYSNLKIQLMATGENTGTWGNVTNDNLGVALEQAIVETATVTFASANQTLTLTDSNARQDARALRLNLTGTTGGARDLIVPAIQKPYLVNNGTADTITVKVSGQTGIAVPAGKSMLLYNNGTDVGLAFNRVVADVVGNVTGTASNATVLETARNIGISGGATAANVSFDGSGPVDLNVTAINASVINAGTLGVANGGTGATTLNSEAVIIGNTTGAVKFVGPGSSGNVLTSNGTAWVSQGATSTGANVQTFDTSGTWCCPASGSMAQIQVWGAGGGASRGTSPVNGAGGGGGGHSTLTLPLCCLSSTVCVVVGAGGTGRTSTDGNGTGGGTSCFGTCVRAGGGGGATTSCCGCGGDGGRAINSGGSGIIVTMGGNLIQGCVLTCEGFGARSGDGRDGVGGFYTGGGGAVSNERSAGSSIYGGGGGGGVGIGPGGSVYAGNGGCCATAGDAPGGGGGGNASAGNGANGAAGRVIVTVW